MAVVRLALLNGAIQGALTSVLEEITRCPVSRFSDARVSVGVAKGGQTVMQDGQGEALFSTNESKVCSQVPDSYS